MKVILLRPTKNCLYIRSRCSRILLY